MTTLPSILDIRLRQILSDDYTGVMTALAKPRKGSLRLNLLKGDGQEVFDEFSAKGIIIEPFSPLPGVYMFDREHEYAIKGTRAFYDGKIYLQSIASMLPVLALDVAPKQQILDVCAAPGSKTTQLAMLMQDQGSITAIEQNQIRYDKLMYNCRLQGATIVEGVKMDAKKYLSAVTQSFDRILVDAPCSAEGRILMSDERTYGFWSLENIRKKSEIQSELLSLAWQHLKPGGVMIYSTCTLAPEENEGVISKLISEYPDAELQPIDIGLTDEKWWRSGLERWDGDTYDTHMTYAVRILPSDITEGFFIAKIKKLSNI